MDYVRLMTTNGVSWQSNYDIGFGLWVFIISCLISGALLTAVSLLNMRGNDGEQSETKHLNMKLLMGMAAFAMAFLVLIISSSVHTTANYANASNETVGANMSIVERSYGVRDLQPATGDKSDLENVLLPAASASTKFGQYHGDKATRLEVTAKNSSDQGVRRLILQVDNTNRLRVYEGVGDSQHLLKPVASSTEN